VRAEPHYPLLTLKTRQGLPSLNPACCSRSGANQRFAMPSDVKQGHTSAQSLASQPIGRWLPRRAPGAPAEGLNVKGWSYIITRPAPQHCLVKVYHKTR